MNLLRWIGWTAFGLTVEGVFGRRWMTVLAVALLILFWCSPHAYFAAMSDYIRFELEPYLRAMYRSLSHMTPAPRTQPAGR